ncbi:hypothetical protein OROMI_015496 [Orobanche minor]
MSEKFRPGLVQSYLYVKAVYIFGVSGHTITMVQLNRLCPYILYGTALMDYIPSLSPIRLSDIAPIIRDRKIPPMFLEIFPHESEAKYSINFSSITEMAIPSTP